LSHRRSIPLFALLAALLSLASCAAPEHESRASLQAMPTDFALEVYVIGKGDASADLANRTAHYVVEPNRRFRVTAGPRATERRFPRIARVLRPWEYEDLFARIKSGSLMTEASTDAGLRLAAWPDESGALGYDVLITAYGKTHRYATTPEESPATASLVARLAELPSGAPGTVLR